jgi:hypothetical protein
VNEALDPVPYVAGCNFLFFLLFFSALVEFIFGAEALIYEPPAAGSYRTLRQTLLFEEALGIFGSRGRWRCLRCGKIALG